MGGTKNDGLLVFGDIEEFVSPIDGTIITGRKSYRDHCKRYNVTNTSDFKEQWARQAEERASAYIHGAGYDRQRRREALARAYKEHKNYGEFQRAIEKLRR